MRKIYLLLFIIALLLNSCKEKGNSNIEVYENIVKGKKVELRKIQHFVIKEDSTSYIGLFIFAKYRNGRLVLSDFLEPNLFFIDKNNGEIIKKIKFKKGKGPGEVIKIEHFEIINDRIYISDMGNFRWSIYDTSGNFIKSIRPFSDKPIKKDEVVEGYLSNASVMETYNNKIYCCIIEAKYYRELQQHKSKAIAILDSSLKVVKVFGFMDEIFGKLKAYFIRARLAIDKEGCIYYTQAPTYRIYKYDSEGNFIKGFGVKGKYRMIQEDVPFNISAQEFRKKILNSSFSDAIFSFSNNYILYQFLDHTDKLYETNSFLDNKYYLKVYDTDGNYFPSDIKLPGWLIAVDDENKLYIYENDEPGNRIVGVYELKIVKD